MISLNWFKLSEKYLVIKRRFEFAYFAGFLGGILIVMPGTADRIFHWNSWEGSLEQIQILYCAPSSE